MREYHEGHELLAMLAGVTWDFPVACVITAGGHSGLFLSYALTLAKLEPFSGKAQTISVFSTVGVSFGMFVGAAILSMPKQFVPVYIGYALQPENSENTTAEKVEKAVLVLTIIITIIAFKWIDRKMKAARPEYIYSRRKARQAKALAAASNGPHFVNLQEVRGLSRDNIGKDLCTLRIL
ncbi:hypothetical protein C8R43DRAFT_1137564 [Mycena crocata]|nr:hypothetical protein C8R43DRAFT_1137564 [Mycena crocata]